MTILTSIIILFFILVVFGLALGTLSFSRDYCDETLEEDFYNSNQVNEEEVEL